MKIILDNTKLFFYKNHLFFVGYPGLATFDISKLSINCQIVIEKRSFKICLINSNFYNIKNVLSERLYGMVSKFNNIYKKKILIYGIGFRCWASRNNLKKINLVLKIGFSRDIYIEVPHSIKIVILKPTLILLKSFDKLKLNQFASFLHSVKSPDIYKGKGLQFINEKIILKSGKHK